MNINDISYIYINNDNALSEALKLVRNSRILGVDTETTGLEPQNSSIRLLQIAAEGDALLMRKLELQRC